MQPSTAKDKLDSRAIQRPLHPSQLPIVSLHTLPLKGRWREMMQETQEKGENVYSLKLV